MLSSRWRAEHGLSMLIEHAGQRVLFDGGQGPALLPNLALAGIRANELSALVLSHGHYDHAGGFKELFDAGDLSEKKLYSHPDVFGSRYSRNADGSLKPIGLSWNADDARQAGLEYVPMKGQHSIAPGITAFNEIPQSTSLRRDERLTRDKGHGPEPDPFLDDTSLLVDAPGGPVLVLGCAHAGVVEIMEHIAAVRGLDHFQAVIGGSHLEHAPEFYLLRLVETLDRFRVKTVALNHCTGFTAAARLYRVMPRRFTVAPAGAVFEF
jgi:7,8-dihydropterin-6-yl-methyl-4-(beta-D-ribofuranosyl)aminobenzene 5'-phosphate synthase